MTRPRLAPEPAGTDLDRLVHRTRLLGGQDDLVVRGGGNTSTKTRIVDPLGRERRALLVKGSGTDMATIGPDGFAALDLDALFLLREREALSDDAMVAALAHCAIGPALPRPSIETLLHAFLPATHVDHVHADAVCALTKVRDPAAAVREALGADVAFEPYIRPGFELAKRVSQHAGLGAVVLEHHGLVTWDDSAAASVERTYALVERAQAYLRAERAHAGGESAGLSADEERDVVLALRGALSESGRRVLSVDRRGRAIADRDDLDAIARAGAATADHLLRIRPWPVIVRRGDDPWASVAQVRRRYELFAERHRARLPVGLAMRDPDPTVAIVPGLGTVAAGRDAADARAIANAAYHTHVAATAAIDHSGSARSLADEDVFDIEHWPLELAKRRTSERELEGRIVVVTGAASGIGRECARLLAHLGAHLVLNDVDAAGLDDAAREIGPAARGIATAAGDVSDQRVVDGIFDVAVDSFGGLDGVVSNAGTAATGRIADLDPAEWDRSMAVNLRAHFLVARAALRILERQRLGGSIVFVASKNALGPGAGFGAYSVAKAGEVQLARIVALEAGSAGVRANAVCPDAVFAGSRLWSAEVRESRAKAHGVGIEDLERFYAERNLLKVPVRAHDVADTVAFLLSDRSSRTTGGVIAVDGGIPEAFPR